MENSLVISFVSSPYNLKNMSCKNDFDRDIYIAFYESDRMVKCMQYNVKLTKQEQLTDYIDMELSGKDCEVKLLVWNKNITPTQRAKKIPLILNTLED